MNSCSVPMASRTVTNSSVCPSNGRVIRQNRCHSLAPELFELDDFGNAMAVGDGAVPPGMEDRARLAAANCPEHAVEIAEDGG